MKKIKLFPIRFFIFILFLAISGQNLPAAEIEELAEIKVTSLRDTLTVENFPGSITIFTEEEIKKKQHQTVKDLLQGELGLDVVQSGGQGGQTSIFMRAQGSASTLVIIDGVEVKPALAGGFDFGDLTLDNVERIEVLRGPQSIQWGADAVGGVINIVTKKGAGSPTQSLTFEAGSFGTFNQSIRSSGSFDNFDYSLSASLRTTDGISALNKESGGTEADGSINKTISARLGYNFSLDTNWQFITRYIKSLDEFDNVNGQFSSFNNDNNNSNNVDEFYLSAPFQTNFGGWWDLKLTPTLYYQDAFTIATTANDKVINRAYTLDLQNNVELNRYFSILWGGEYEHKEGVNVGGTSFGDGFHELTDNEAFFLQGIFEYQNNLILTAGFREDINSTFDEITTYKFDAGYRLAATNTKLHMSYSKGFRAPSFNELFAPPAPGGGGLRTSNPLLQPEVIKSFEVGMKQDFMDKRIQLALTFFNSVTSNFIQSAPTTFVQENLGKLRSKGLETSVNIELPYHLSLSMRHTWNDHVIDAKSKSNNNQPATRRPKHKFIANLSHNWDNKLDTLVGLFVRSSATDFDATNKTDGFATVRAALTYQYNKNIKLTLRGENLLDEDYIDLGGFGTAGINGYGGFIYMFD